MAKEKYIGADGCKAGWFFVTIGPGDEAQYGIFENMERLAFFIFAPEEQIDAGVFLHRSIRIK